MISFDTETSGTDHHHGTRPYYLTTCTDTGMLRTWQWNVDPLTRKVTVPPDDIDEIRSIFFDYQNDPHHGERAGFVAQNGKFDTQALTTIIPEVETRWPWGITHDTLLAAHVLASNKPKNLTVLAAMYLGTDISPYETELATAVQKARRLVQQAKIRAGKAGANTLKPDPEPTNKVKVPAGLFSRGSKSKNLIKTHGPLDQLSKWMIAGEDLTDTDGNYEMPSAGKQNWRADYWLPRVMIDAFGADTIAAYSNVPLAELQRWPVLLQEYSDVDSQITMQLWNVIERKLHQRGLWKLYDARRNLSEIVYRMERRGVTMHEGRLYGLQEEYKEDSARLKLECEKIAAGYGYDLVMSKGTTNSLRSFIFDVMKLPPIRNKKAKTDAPALDAKNAIPYYLETLEKGSRERTFIESMVGMRKKNTALAFMEAYGRFMCKLPTGKHHVLHTNKTCKRCNGPDRIFDQRCPICDWGLSVCRICNAAEIELDNPCVYRDWHVLYPNFNSTGSDTLRFTCSNPNGQQISKQEAQCKECDGEGCELCHFKGYSLRSLRWLFGPAPGREWYSFDAKNIELRIPAYESGQKEFIDLFERPDDLPYFGSNHALIAHLLFPKEFDQSRNEQGDIDGRVFKKLFPAQYQRIKNGNFAVQYGAVDRPDGTGTADLTYGIKGAQAMIAKRFAAQDALNRKWIAFAERHGYVETLPDKTVDPTRGYPVMCSRTDYGKIKPTVPLNYHVQSTAGWWMFKAMLRVSTFFQRINAGELFADKVWKGGYHIVLQVHDELVLDMPKRVIPGNPLHTYNAPIVEEVRRLMQLGGDDIGIPVPVSAEYHSESWAEGQSV